jgi:hypothetical protein
MFEEGDHIDKFFVFDVTGPWLEEDGVFRLSFDVLGFCVEDDCLGEGAIEV